MARSNSRGINDDFDVEVADMEPEQVATIWRRMPIGGVVIDQHSNKNITVSALEQIVSHVVAQHEKGSGSLNPLHDAFEFQYQGHVVNVKLGEATEL